MGTLRRLRRLGADERGSVLTIFAVAIPTFILVLALALDIGNWYVHKEKLQTRVDNAAFAAALEYGYRFPACTGANNGPREQPMIDVAKKYAGATAADFNKGVNEEGKLQVVVNGDGSQDADTLGPCDLHVTGDVFSPEGGYWTEVNGTEREVVSLFGGFGVPVPAIRAEARVAVVELETSTGDEPFAAPNGVGTDCVSATFGNVGSVPLTQVDPAADPTLWRATTPSGWDMPNGWPNDDNVLPVDIRVGTGGCGSGESSDFENMAGISAVDQAGFPQVNEIELIPVGGCDPYFVPFDGAPCQVRVRANVQFQNPNNPEVTALVEDHPNLDLQPQGGGEWLSSGSVTIDPRDGMADNNDDGYLTVRLRLRNNNGNFGTETWQHIQAGNDLNQGPIEGVTLSERFVNVGGSNDNNLGGITITVRLRDFRGSGPGVQVIDDGLDCSVSYNANLQSTFRDGCQDTYAVANPPGTCSASAPWTCLEGVASSLSSLENDYDERWAPGGSCVPNNWSSYPNIPRGDTRLITVFGVDAGELWNDTSSPSDDYSIAGIVGFYVTGWAGQPGSCNGINDSPPRPQQQLNQGQLWGHFVPYVSAPSGGSGGTAPCDPDRTRACIAVLVR
jgi:hypothetical protein